MSTSYMASTSAAAAARRAQMASASQMTGLFSEVSPERFIKLLEENKTQANIGTIKVHILFTSRRYKLATQNVNGINIVCFFPENYIPDFDYIEIGEISNPMGIIRSQADTKATQTQTIIFIIGFLFFIAILSLIFGLIIAM